SVVQGTIGNGSDFYRLNESEWDLLNDRCGRNVAVDSAFRLYHKISFGSNALQGEFPWALKLFRFDAHPSKFYIMCSASLISQKHFVTAAHCLEIAETGLVDVVPSHLYVVLGGTPCTYAKVTRIFMSDLKDCRSLAYKSPWRLKVKRFIVPKRSVIFNMEESDFLPKPMNRIFSDLAIFELEEALDLDFKDIQPICLPNPSHPIPKLYKVYGFGRTVRREEDSRVNMQLHWYYENNLLSRFACLRFPFTVRGCGGYFVTKRPIGDLRSACKGDSGGGLSAIVSGRHRLYGVVSYAVNYCDNKTEFSSVYVNVSFNHDFICYYTGICPMGYNVYLNSKYATYPEPVAAVGFALRRVSIR
uniref:Peptidase S1 domain-containing protein n=1 Tax=Parascaris univalens TaxID=6257 RepID=A0A915B6Z3_PARUN